MGGVGSSGPTAARAIIRKKSKGGGEAEVCVVGVGSEDPRILRLDQRERERERERGTERDRERCGERQRER